MQVFTTKRINELQVKVLNGETLKRTETIFYQGNINLKKDGLYFSYTEEEKIEYAKCYSDKIYFIEKYLDIKLHSFQKEIIKHYDDNRFSIFMNSKRIGFLNLLSALLIHDMLFNLELFIQYHDINKDERNKFFNIFKGMYQKIPFFLQVGVKKWNLNYIILGNINGIRIDTITKYPSIARQIDRLIINNMADVNDNTITSFYNNIIPSISATSKSKIILSSSPNGRNFFSELVQGSEYDINNPRKNLFSTLRTYWHQVPGRDKNWKDEEIKLLKADEPEIYFDEKYALLFIDLRYRKLSKIIK